MPVRVEPGCEPIPGYKLIERLGGGGFGEVWKAEVPGGLFKALKFVYGDLEAADDEEGSRAGQELKALSRVKTVHHPYILSLERYDIIDGQLVITMELADRTMWDRFKECRREGLIGIPREELLNYTRETAEALDLMNIQFQLQHLDIKPQNLFLVFNHVKVADFGLVKDLGDMGAATITGGVTPVYAAPETFDGWLSRHSDQYSLAIVYQELLTGQRPFGGSTMRQLVMQHLQGVPDVSPLPEAERPVILRALSKNPDDRFPTCEEMVAALKNSTTSSATVPVAMPKPAPPHLSAPRVSELPPRPGTGVFQGDGSQLVGEGDKTWATRKPTPPAPSPVAFNVPSFSPEEVTPAGVPTSRTQPPPTSKLPPRPEKKTLPAPAPALPPSSVHVGEESVLGGIVQPALVIGLGQSGIEALQQLRRVLTLEHGHPDAVPHIRLLAIDTDVETQKSAGLGESRSSLRPQEFLLARLHRANHYVAKSRADGKIPTEKWLNNKLLYRIAKDNCKAPIRPLGRFAFVTNYPVIVKRLESELQACASQDTLHEVSTHTDLGIRNQVPRVYVLAGLGGATAGGMFIDTAYVVRSHLRKMGLERAEIVGLFFLPPVAREGIRSGPLANAYASLSELNYFNQHGGMKARYDAFENREPLLIDEAGPPFDRCIFLNLAEPKTATDPDQIPEAVLQAGQFLYRDLVTALGKSLDSMRKRQLGRLSSLRAFHGPILESFGLYRLCWPRRELQQRLAERFCVQIVERWKTKNAKPIAAQVEEWVGQQWEALEMRPENLIARHQELCEQALRSTPDKVFQDVVLPVATVLAGKGDASVALALGPTLAAMEQFEQMMGIPDSCRDVSHRNMEPGTLERTLSEVSAGIADQCDQRLAELVVSLIEAPQYRLAGAEEALRKFNKVVEAALGVQETLGKELSERAAALYRRLQDFISRVEKKIEPAPNTAPANSTQWFGRKATSASNLGGDLLELLRVYPKAQFQALLLQCLNRLYVSLRGHLSDQLREVGFCRQRLDELAGLLAPERKTPEPSARRVDFQRYLLPAGCQRMDDVLALFQQQLEENDWLALDELVQTHIRKQYKALLNVCLGASGMVRALAPVMLQEAEGYLDQRFPPPSVIELLQAQEGNDGQTPDLQELVRMMFDEAAPDSKLLGEDRGLSLAALPNDEAGQLLAAAVTAALPETKIVATDRCDEIVVLREQILQSLLDLEQMGPIAQEAYRQRLAQDPAALHTREDIGDWLPETATAQ